ncbi:MAG: hypothetical protein ACM3OB_10390 [Acidobacteriota bacterium]
MSGFLNLARRPFLNARPVSRIAVLLWVLGAGLGVANVLLFRGYLRGTAGLQTQLADLAQRRAATEQAIGRAEAELKGADLEHLNREVEFLNERIAERRFGWSRLFDRLAEVLPGAVRIRSLASVNIVPAGRDARRVARLADRFELRILGTAQSDEALLQLVDALFRHPAFSAPNLSREARQSSGEINFDLTVTYLPAAKDAPETAPPAAAPAATPPAGAGGQGAGR